jgi:glutathionylspermidine synthase
MYPFEWLAKEVGHDELLAHDLEDIEMIEPAWKLILGNKAILPLLWEMFPNHANLLPSYFIDPVEQLTTNVKHQEKPLSDSVGEEFVRNTHDLNIKEWISKPKFGREGHGVLMSKDFLSYSEFVT